MNKMKRTVALLMVLCLVFAMAACGGDSGDAKTGGDAKDDVKTVEYAKGVLTEESFESEFIGLRYELPENMLLATQEEMDAMIDFGGEIAYTDAEKKILDYAAANTVYEMMVMSGDSSVNAFLMTEKLPVKSMTVEQYFDAVKKQLEAAGMGYVFSEEMGSLTVAGQDYTVLSASTDMSGMTLKQDYAFRKIDNRMAGFIITYSDSSVDMKDQMMSGFKAY